MSKEVWATFSPSPHTTLPEGERGRLTPSVPVPPRVAESHPGLREPVAKERQGCAEAQKDDGDHEEHAPPGKPSLRDADEDRAQRAHRDACAAADAEDPVLETDSRQEGDHAFDDESGGVDR